MQETSSRVLAVVLALAPAMAWEQSSTGLPDSALSGGTLSVVDESRTAYSHSLSNLDARQAELFALGHRMFSNRWAFFWFENAEFGRGPTSNAQACTICHLRNGRGVAPGTAAQERGEDGEVRDHHITVPFEPAPNAVIRISVTGQDEHGGPKPHPFYGDQLQIFGVKGVVAVEGRFEFRWQEQTVTFVDGEVMPLRAPVVTLSELAYGPLGQGAMFGARLAPPLIGLGLLEAVPEEAILTLAARPPVEGMAGHINRVWDQSRGRAVLGRFGLKANHGSVREQVAAAFINDIGLSTSVYPDQNCPPVQANCKEQMVAGRPEITDLRLAATELYVSALAVPARRNVGDPQVMRGEHLFGEARCERCHVSEMHTGDSKVVSQLAGQTIHPYTDLLLHDMGPDLADGRPDYLAGGSEWRTPPLWGIGLSEKVNGAGAFLHDGRARNFSEAILWHGGEAKVSREAFRSMSREDRAALIAFLGSL